MFCSNDFNEMLKVVVVVITGVVLMEIAEAHKKVHSDMEENVSLFKIYLHGLLLL